MFFKEQKETISFRNNSLLLIMTIEWNCCSKNVTHRNVLEALLPDSYNYKVHEFNIEKVSEKANEHQFKACLDINVCTKEDMLTFMELFEFQTKTTYNHTNHSDKTNQKFLAYSGTRKCVHNPQKRTDKKDKSAGKNTVCPSKLAFKVRNTDEHEHDDDGNCLLFSTNITLEYTHNHSIECASAFKYHKISSSTKEKYESLFKAGHSASSAHRAYKEELQQAHPQNYVKMFADRSILPELRWVFHAHEQYVKTHYGHINSPEAYRLAEERCREYNLKNGDNLSSIHKTDDGHYFVIICDAFSRRVHEVIIKTRFRLQ